MIHQTHLYCKVKSLETKKAWNDYRILKNTIKNKMLILTYLQKTGEQITKTSGNVYINKTNMVFLPLMMMVTPLTALKKKLTC